MTLYAPLPSGGQWVHQELSAHEFRGTKANEMLAPKTRLPSVIVGGGGADHLVSTEGKTTFKYNRLTDSLSTGSDIIFSFRPQLDKIDISDMLWEEGIEKINYVGDGEKLNNIGDGYLRVDNRMRITTLRVKVNNHGPDFMVKIDGRSVNKEHIIDSRNNPAISEGVY